MNGLCKYADIFGKPNQGVHSTRIFGLAFIDLLFTLIGAYFVDKYVNKKTNIIFMFLVLWGIGIILHILFCVQTPVTKLLGF